MGKSECYKFNLRKDMPRGFKANPAYPELPAILEYLQQYEGQTFSSPEVFQSEVLDQFLKWLSGKNIPVGGDPKIRQGLHVEQLPERYNDISGVWDCEVFTPATNGPGKCVYGGLEKTTLS